MTEKGGAPVDRYLPQDPDAKEQHNANLKIIFQRLPEILKASLGKSEIRTAKLGGRRVHTTVYPNIRDVRVVHVHEGSGQNLPHGVTLIIPLEALETFDFSQVRIDENYNYPAAQWNKTVGAVNDAIHDMASSIALPLSS